jgi:hypothetical protein
VLVQYKEITDYVGYRFGDDGSVWSLWVPHAGPTPRLGKVWRRRKPVPQGDGHLGVSMPRGTRKNRLQLVHALILEAFVGPCPPGLECRHLDGNPANNRLDNLIWGTRIENQDDRRRHGIIGKGLKTQPPKPCLNCGRLTKPRINGRCNACNQYFKTHGKERTAEAVMKWHANHGTTWNQ